MSASKFANEGMFKVMWVLSFEIQVLFSLLCVFATLVNDLTSIHIIVSNMYITIIFFFIV